MLPACTGGAVPVLVVVRELEEHGHLGKCFFPICTRVYSLLPVRVVIVFLRSCVCVRGCVRACARAHACVRLPELNKFLP